MIPVTIVHTSTNRFRNHCNCHCFCCYCCGPLLLAMLDASCAILALGWYICQRCLLFLISAFHSVLPVVGLVTMAHLQRALSNHCCYWQLRLLGSQMADAGSAGELPQFASKAMSLALRFHHVGIVGILGDTLPGPLQSHVPFSGVVDRRIHVRERHCSEWSKVSLRPAFALASL